MTELTSPLQLYQLAIAQLRASTFGDRQKWTRPLILVKSSPQEILPMVVMFILSFMRKIA
ncbi:hypothetical protein [Nostoc sp. LPT]|uniref:hypothetical protein n=1 Tax=Nostoc sp. LPT TaxID=2815387 RepID=UPI001E1AADEB|nr:hypothetical protein [Nostoc sp. LPT]MBN4003709.1 hypothetical protein [Nostoc sp. LPT]